MVVGLCYLTLTTLTRLAVTYKDIRSVPDFVDKTILAVKAPPDTILNCDIQEVNLIILFLVILHGHWLEAFD